MQNKVYIIIPVFNRLKFTKKCLTSLAKQKYKSFEVILVDDGSTDGTEEYFRKTHPSWSLIRGTGNWWWTRSMFEGVNLALKRAKKGDFILTMNNDCYSKSNYLSQIVKVSQENKRAIVGSLILDAEKPSKVHDAGVRIEWETGAIYSVANTVTDKASFYKQRKIIDKIDTLPGKGTLIPVEIFSKIGNFNYKRLPHYIGDYEFFCRAKKRGLKLLVGTKARLYNFTKQTGFSHATSRVDYKTATHLLLGRKSKLNIIDHLNFILLCCPKKHMFFNFRLVLWKVILHLLRLFPFYYIGPAIAKTRLYGHNFPILMRQSYPRVKKYKKKYNSKLS